MKQAYIDALNHAYASTCQCGHAANLHARDNGDSHAGDGSFGLCGCVLSAEEAALISQARTIAQQHQTIDALTAALEQIKNIQSATNDPSTAANNCMDIATAALEKARGESSQQSNANLETPCVNCGSRTFVYLQSGKRQCVVCKD